MFEFTKWADYRRSYNPSFPKTVLRKLLSILVPFVPGPPARCSFYRLMGVRVGERVFIGRGCYIDDSFPELVHVEDDVIISFRVIVVAHDRARRLVAPVKIGKGAFIGTGAIILPGVTVGAGAVVGAGCVVYADVPAGSTVVGASMRFVDGSAL